MKTHSLLIFSVFIITSCTQAQSSSDKFDLKKYQKGIEKERQEKNKEFKESDSSPLSPKARKKFRALTYYPVNPTYRVQATMEVTPDTKFFEMPTSSGKIKRYRQYALLHFTLNGKKIKLPIYQGQALMFVPKYRNYIFIPFTDLTNGKTTYGAGRYIEYYLPKNQSPQKDKAKKIILDFNTAYNPYCAYNTGYSCPIPPRANHLPIKIEAGEKQFKK